MKRLLPFLVAMLAGCAHAPLATVKAPTALAARAVQPGFMWGVATAGFQSEGGDHTSNWAAWEQAGKLPQPIGRAIDGWHRFTEDADLTASLGLGAYRLSLEWAKLEPAPGKHDLAAVQHYHDVLKALRERGLEPVVTVSHWVYPAWLDEPDAEGKRGWESERMQTALATHAAWLAREFGPEVKWWLTLNEPNTLGPAAYVVGMYPPAKHDMLAYQKVMQHQIAAHKLAYDAIHANDPDAQVSLCPIAINYPDTPGNGAEGFDPHLYLDEREIYDQVAPHHADYVAFNYFHSLRLHDYVKVSKSWTWPVYPRGIYEVSKDLYARYRKPLMITENGMATFRGQPRGDHWTREAFLVQHVSWLQKAMAEGVPVLGYMHWSIADNYEWGSHDPRFGLFGVDPDDLALKRVRTPAADVYQAIARAGGVSVEQLAHYKAP